MRRSTRLKQCRMWRRFIADLQNCSTAKQAMRVISGLSSVESVQVEHGWTTWVTVEMDNGYSFVESGMWAIDMLKMIGQRMYNKYVGEYLDYVKLIKKWS